MMHGHTNINYSRHMKTDICFNVIYPHFLTADIERVPENRSQRFPSH